MFSVMIVDDDDNIRNGLHLLVPWEELGFEIVERAADGKEALEKYRKGRFDLIVADIQMPKMNGLDFISAVRKMDPFVHFLILSGHAAFDYAKRSIDSRVDGYILKPIDENELETYLRKIGAILKKEKEEVLFMVGENMWRCEMMIQNIISGDLVENEESVHHKAEQIGLLWPSYQVLLVDFEVDGDTGLASVNIRRRLKRLFGTNARGVVFKRDRYHGVLLNNAITREVALNQLRSELNKALGDCCKAFYAAIGEPVAQLAQIIKSYETADMLLKNRFVLGKGSLIARQGYDPGSAGRSGKDDENALNIKEMTNKLYYSLDVGNLDAIRQLIDEYEAVTLQGKFPENTIKTDFLQIVTTALNMLLHAGRIESRAIKEYTMKLAEIYSQPDFLSLRKFIFNLLSDIVGLMEKRSGELLAKKIIDFIERNYGDKLTLELLADMFNYSGAYLGRLFKKETGVNFNTYLDMTRIRKAKDFLLKGMKVYETANHTGFSNVDYFHSKFRKYVGMSPTEFRRRNLES